MDIEPDTKDWTWVLGAPCPECGLSAGDVPPAETAIADDYAAQDSAIVARALVAAGERMIEVLGSVPGDAWDRTGVRSNGSEFTVATRAQYYLHDVRG